MNPGAAAIRSRARVDRRKADELRVKMTTVWDTIQMEMDRYTALSNERKALLARADDADTDASSIDRADRFPRRSPN